MNVLFDAGIANELFPLILFIGIGAMIDFGPLLSNPKLMLFGAAAQFGIFFTLGMALAAGLSAEGRGLHLRSSARRTARPPSSWRTMLTSNYLGAIMVAAYSYMALVPIIQPPVIKLITTQKGTHDPHAV